MEIRESSFNFPRSTGGGQSASQTITHAREVERVAVGMTGYSATFEDEDHHVGRLTAELWAEIDEDDATEVRVSGQFALRDWSGEFDDPYSGNIQWVLLAELVPATPPGPGEARGDLLIEGAEITQVIQHFRSAEHLEAANVYPDNSIRLVADKPTVVRVYVDYDATSGLPPIYGLTGELEVASGAASTLLAPLEQIVPRRGAAVERGQRAHTMNFLIPENLCRGVVNLRARVMDNFNDTQFSRDFERQLQFDVLPELPIMAVGIDYQGPDVYDDAEPDELTVPEESDFVDVFGFTELVYPIPAVAITSYQTMIYDEEITSDINEGCDKFDDLKDAVGELRGDSNDIVYGLLNTGVDTGSVGGCGSGGVGVGKVGRETTAAHEVGHALGRQHAPCDNVTRCGDPHNEDPNYPQYSGYDSDSIGEYGFDPDGMVGRVVRPATAHDLMGYSDNEWISPYTYKALMSRIPEEFEGATPASGTPRSAGGTRRRRLSDGEWIRVKTPHLFLRIDIRRDRQVRFHVAFHFDTLPRGHAAHATAFSVELQDKAGNVLRTTRLYADATCCGCRPTVRSHMRIRQGVAFDPRAHTLVLYEKDDVIGEWSVGDPPPVSVECSDDPAADAVRVAWDTQGPEDAKPRELWFLVQWRDDRGTWRGCAPRTQERELVVPKPLFAGQRQVAIRVLASAGIATGVGQCEVELEPREPSPARRSRLEITLAGVSTPPKEPVELAPRIRVVARSPQGAMVSQPEVRWYDEQGGEIGRGRSFNLRKLPEGPTLLSAAVFERGQGSGTARWLIQRTPTGKFRLLHGTTQAEPRRNAYGRSKE